MKPLIVANWKCNPTSRVEAKQLFDSIKRGIGKVRKAEVVICPPFVFLSNIQYLTPNIKLGAQDVFWEKQGAYTGEVSSFMLKDNGCKYVIVGHSERRRYFAETDEMVNKKLKAVLGVKLSPIFCIGETQEQRDKGETENVLKKQIQAGLKKVSSATLRGVRFASSKFQVSRTCIAYEPIWAIGTGNPCDIEEAQKMALLIRKIVSKIYNQAISKNVQILYGGSVNSKNAAGYIKEAGFQGLLVGGASLKAKEFVSIVKAAI